MKKDAPCKWNQEKAEAVILASHGIDFKRNYMKQILTDPRGEIHRDTTIVGKFNMSFTLCIYYSK